MSYRLPPRPDRRMPVMHAAMQSNVVMDNGTIAHLAVPFFRKFGKIVTKFDIMVHDHHGWPRPGRLDHSWQPHRSFNSHPIDLMQEGYDEVEIDFRHLPDGLSAEGRIERNVVRVDIAAICPDAIDEDLHIPFSVYIVGTSLRDVAIKGILHIVAGMIDVVIDEGDQDDPDSE